MKFTAKTAILRGALVVAAKACDNKHQSWGSSILVEASTDQVTFSAHGQWGLSVSCDAAVTEPGWAIVTGSKLESVLKMLTDEDLAVESSEADLTLQTSAGTIQLALLGEEAWLDLLRVTTPPDEKTVVLQGAEFVDLVHKTAFAAAVGETNRPVLQGINITLNSHVTALASDSVKLAMATLDPAQPAAEETTFLAPAAYLHKLAGFVAPQESFTLAFHNQKMHFSQGPLAGWMPLLSGSYPDFARLLPEVYPVQFQVGRKEFLHALGLAAVAVDKNVMGVTLTIGEEALDLQVKGENSASLRVAGHLLTPTESDPLKVAFNPAMLADCLQEINADNVQFDFSGPESPARLSGDPGTTIIVLPVRMR